METVEVVAKKWGSSVGIIIPKDIAEKEKIKEGSRLEIIIRKPVKVDMNKVFGSLKGWKKPTDRILKEVDKEL
jgi:bifunctional DNA-binding transcriptional regulator/antitoxin component of YhaV-PrlF toxin-antitoxin module